MLLDLADFALQAQPEDNLVVAISRAWYNGSYTMDVKPIKSLELHYTMTQFLIIRINSHWHTHTKKKTIKLKVFPIWCSEHVLRLLVLL